MEGLNILFLSETLYPHGGGAELATYLYANLVSRAGHDVLVITNRFAGESETYQNSNLRLYRLPLFDGSGIDKYSILRRVDLLLSSRIKAILKWADVIYVPRFWFSAIPIAKSFGKCVVVHLHDYVPICPLATVYDQSREALCNDNRWSCHTKCICAFERTNGRDFVETTASTLLNSTLGHFLGKLVGLSDMIICVSKAQKERILSKAPSLEAKTHVIYNPLPEVPYVEINGDDLAYFGGPNSLKGFRVLCQAIEYMHQNYLRYFNIHATKFNSSDDHFAKAKCTPHITPYGKLNYDELETLYRHVRAVVVPSIWPEPSPYVVSEALLRGRLVIASRIGGIPELVEDLPGVFLFRAADYKELAEKMVYVKDLRRETVIDLGTRNRERTLGRLSNEKTVSEFIQMLTAAVRK